MSYQDLYDLAHQKFAASGTETSLADWIVDNTTLRRRPFSYTRYPFQQRIADDEHPNMSVIKCSQVGLALPLTTPLPTPSGWTTMGDIQTGDTLFGLDGKPTLVTFKSPIYHDRNCYEIKFDDGSTQIADADHRWFVKTSRGPFNETGVYTDKGRPLKDKSYKHEGVVTTQFLFNNLSKTTFYIPVANSLQLSDVTLPVDPYVYGSWLGDGNRYSATLTIGDQDIIEIKNILADRGVTLVYSSLIQYRMLNQFNLLRQMGVIGEAKRIPMKYQRASIEQRLELLRGLMDTDGSITAKGRASFHNTEEGLVADVQDLLHGLGYKTRTRWRKPNGSGFGGKKLIAEVSFVPDEVPVFNLVRKKQRQQNCKPRIRFTKNRSIVSITPVSSVPVQCLTVDNEQHLFLAGRSFIPTHNTEIQIRKFFGMLRRENGVSGIFSFPNEAMYKRNYATRMKPIIENDAVFNPPVINKPIRRMDLTQIGDSFGYVTGCGESDATSINADILFHDELDLSPPDMISLFQSRLQGSDKRVTQSFSTPTFLGYGIDRNFALSDQHYYQIRCSSCNHWQFPMFNQSFVHIPKMKFDVEHLTDLTAEQINELDLRSAYVGCQKCHKPLDLVNTKYREWVPNFPQRINNRGYKMNPFSTDRLDLTYIFGQLQKYREKENLKGFFNTVLGEPFTESSAQLQEDQIRKVMAPSGRPPEVGQDTAVYMGIDMGQICHIVLCGDVDTDGKDPFFLFDTCHAMQLSERIADLRKVYNIVQCCVDRYPYTPTVDAFRENTAGLIMPIHFGGNSAVMPKFDESETLIYYIANRTSMLDRVRTVIVNETAVLAGYGGYKETLVTHLRDMVRDETALEKEPEWKKLNGNDHFFFAAGYALLARRVCENIFTRQYSKNLMVLNVGATSVGTSNISNLTNNKNASKLGFGR